MLFNRHTIPNALRALARVFSRFAKREDVLASEIVRDIRLLRCQECNFQTAGQCSICTCVVSAKTLLASERCPAEIPRWVEQSICSSGLFGPDIYFKLPPTPAYRQKDRQFPRFHPHNFKS